MQADENERTLRDSKLLVHDEALNRYLKAVICGTVGADRCHGVRIYVIEIPVPNASMAPNGTMLIHSGMLLRVRNEAELAAVLGHEFAHFELRHGVNGFKRRRQASNFSAWATVLGGITNTDTRDLQQALVGSIFQYDREQEQDADILGFKYLAAANYPTHSATDFWRHLMAEEDATAVGRGQKPHQRYNAGFLDSHPTSLKRAEYLEAEAKKIGDSGRDSRAGSLRVAIADHLPNWLDAQVKQNDFGGSEHILQQLAENGGWSGELLFARGELYRLRGNPRDIAASVLFYREAVAAGYARPQVHRNLGMSLLRSGQPTDAHVELSEYLRLAPDASDAKAVQSLLAKKDQSP